MQKSESKKFSSSLETFFRVLNMDGVFGGKIRLQAQSEPQTMPNYRRVTRNVPILVVFNQFGDVQSR